MVTTKAAHLTFGLFNAGSLNTGHDDFLIAMDCFQADIVAINETWLAAGTEMCAPAPVGYKLRCAPRPSHMRRGRGGGVAFYYKSNMRVRFLAHPRADIEQMWLSLRVNGKKILVGTAYRPQWVNIDNFIDALTDSLTVFSDHDYCILLGDFNVNLLNASSTDSLKINNFISTLNLRQVVNAPTHTSISNETLIDLVCTNCPVRDVTVTNITGSLGHAMINVNIKILKPKVASRLITYRPLRDIDLDLFNKDLEAMDWESVCDVDSVDNMVDRFNSLVLSLFDVYAPVKSKRIKQDTTLPWMTNNVKYMIYLRNQAHNEFRRSGAESDKRYYKDMRELVTSSVYYEKRAYFNQLVNTCCNDSKTFWKNIKSKILTNPSKSNCLPDVFSNADAINDHFLAVPGQDRYSISDLTFFEYHRYGDSTFKLDTVSERVVAKYISSITSNALGKDGISRDMLILCLPRVLNVITSIINSSITSGRVPRQWKESLVSPLPKVDNPSNLKQLRPISILPYLSKILEKTIFIQLNRYIESNGVLPPLQSGFRRGRGTATALLDVTDNILSDQDEGRGTILTLLDFSRAFDCLSIPLLLSKLSYYGLDHHAVSWFDSYLSERFQSVKLTAADGSTSISEPKLVCRGVPQGSIIGPLLFIVYTADLTRYIKNSKYHCYADDVQLYISCTPNNIAAAVHKMNEDLDGIALWAERNSLMLNAEKSKFLVLGSNSQICRISESNPSICILGQTVGQVKEARNLGIIFDGQLRFEKHVMSLVSKCFYRLKVLYKIRNLLSENARIKLCESLVLSVLNYGDVVYGPRLLSVTMRLIQRVQNACCRFCFAVPRRSHITPYLNRASMLNMASRRQLHLASLMFDVVTFGKPEYLYTKLRFPHCQNAYGSRAARLPLLVHGHRTVAFEGSFRYQATKCWNNIPPPIRELTSKMSFKKHMKIFLLEHQKNIIKSTVQH